VPDCHPHRARHSQASELLSELPGAEEYLRDRLGHLDAQTLHMYVTISNKAARRVANVASISSKWGL
jgi:site-specific recombinase XerD